MVPNALVLVFDRLGSGYLGPYGNTWIDTPAWNRLAAQATLFETALADSPRLQTLYDSYWYGHHALAVRSDQSPALPQLLADRQIETWLVTDERQLAQRAEAQQFSHRVVLPPGDAQSAESLTETQLAQLFATLVDVLQQATGPFLIWVHAQAMQGPWDAPYQWRLQLADEEDPEPPTAPAPPELLLDDDPDPDLLLGLQQAYGAQVLVLDACLEILLDSLWSSPLADTTALLATAARGYPLGEHRVVGRNHYPLFGELLQVPWLIAGPAAAGATWRMQQAVQPADMYTTLCRWLGGAPGRRLGPQPLARRHSRATNARSAGRRQRLPTAARAARAGLVPAPGPTRSTQPVRQAGRPLGIQRSGHALWTGGRRADGAVGPIRGGDARWPAPPAPRTGGNLSDRLRLNC